MAHSSSASSRAGRAIVVGGTRGIGLASALVLARHGWEVTVCGRDQDRLAAAGALAAERGLTLRPCQIDATSEPSVREAFSTFAETGPVDLCVNSAGTNLSRPLVRRRSDGTLQTHPLDEWERCLTLNLTGVFLCGREAAAAMVAQRTAGVIVNVSSAVYGGAYAQSAYCAAKAGIVSLTRSWAMELADHGIRVVAVAPGVADGPALREKCARHAGHAAYMERLRSEVPLRRWAAEDEIADAVLFAATHPYLTGTTLMIDGGGIPPRVNVPAAGVSSP